MGKGPVKGGGEPKTRSSSCRELEKGSVREGAQGCAQQVSFFLLGRGGGAERGRRVDTCGAQG